MLLQRFAVVSTLLKDLLYISFLVPSLRIREMVPPVLPLRTVGDKVLVSIVIMRNTDVGPVWLPWPRQSYNQLNVRTYVNDPVSGANGVFFFVSGITSLFSLAVPRLLGLPWEKIRLHIETGKGEDGAYRYEATGDFHGGVEAEVREELHPSRFDGFSSVRDAALHITAPDIGFLRANDGQRLLHFRVEHEFVTPSLCQLLNLRFPLLERLGLVAPEEMEQPHSVFLVPRTKFKVHLPPRPMRHN